VARKSGTGGDHPQDHLPRRVRLRVGKLRFEITQLSKEAGLLHWKITNSSDDGIYLYNFFLLGPAYNVERSAGKLILIQVPSFGSLTADSLVPTKVESVLRGTDSTLRKFGAVTAARLRKAHPEPLLYASTMDDADAREFAARVLRA